MLKVSAWSYPVTRTLSWRIPSANWSDFGPLRATHRPSHSREYTTSPGGLSSIRKFLEVLRPIRFHQLAPFFLLCCRTFGIETAEVGAVVVNLAKVIGGKVLTRTIPPVQFGVVDACHLTAGTTRPTFKDLRLLRHGSGRQPSARTPCAADGLRPNKDLSNRP